MSILIVEDDIEIATSLIEGLKQNNFDTVHVVKALDGLKLAQQKNFQLIISDLMLPDMDGLEMISKIREKSIQTPVLILSAKRSLDERVLGFQKGGDDYMVKPFAFIELLARVNSLIRRAAPQIKQTQISFEDLSMNLINREVFRNNIKIELQLKEFLMLEFFLKNQKVILSKAQILQKIWGYDFDPQTNVVDVLVYRLRNKVDKDFDRSYIQTIKGVGYVLKIE
jgi:DNA-binding response OmpR family regulator